MKKYGMARIAATGIVLGLALSGCGNGGQSVASASDSQPSSKDGKAAGMSKDLAKLITKRKAEKAVDLGEELVARQPSHAAYRLQLGEAYLLAGRFTSAEMAFGDALALSPSNQAAALKLALVKSALGKGQDAQDLLENHKGSLPASDYGLAMALAGNAQAGVEALEAASRAPGADARTRQNLALAYSLAGRWVEARTVAAQDLSAGALDARMTQWAQFSNPRSSWDQVAALLGVRPTQDRGMPVQLALNGASSAPVQVAAVEPIRSQPTPMAAPSSDQAPVFELSSLSAPKPFAETQTEVEQTPAPVFQVASRPAEVPLIKAPTSPNKRRPIVETIGKPAPRSAAMASVQKAKPAAKTVAVAAKAEPKKPVQVASLAPVSVGGRYVVQLGAFSSAKAADQAWASVKSKVPALAKYTSSKSSVASGSTTLQRLAATGISSKADADALCAKVKSAGGNCFVRSGQEGAAVQLASKAAAKTTIKMAAKPQPKTVAKVASR